MSKKYTYTMSRMLLLLSANEQEGYIHNEQDASVVEWQMSKKDTHTMSRMLLLLSANEQEGYIRNEQDASVVECK